MTLRVKQIRRDVSSSFRPTLSPNHPDLSGGILCITCQRGWARCCDSAETLPAVPSWFHSHRSTSTDRCERTVSGGVCGQLCYNLRLWLLQLLPWRPECSDQVSALGWPELTVLRRSDVTVRVFVSPWLQGEMWGSYVNVCECKNELELSCSNWGRNLQRKTQRTTLSQRSICFLMRERQIIVKLLN